MTDKLQAIKDQVAIEQGYSTWEDLMSAILSRAYLDPDKWHDMVARRYATLIAENTRAKCAENVDKQSILETKIELI